MELNKEFSKGVINGIETLWHDEDEELLDFTVKVREREFRCHRFVLAASSQFFRGLFRSGMRETETKRVELQDISSETFELVLKVAYTCKDVIDDRNVFDLWHAANQLQIKYLIEECEKFVLKILSLDTFEEIYKNSKMLDSFDVLRKTISFMITNFNTCRKSETVLRLTKDEIVEVVRSPDLVVKTEDFVLEYILNWVKFDPTKSCLGKSNDVVQPARITRKTKPDDEIIVVTRGTEDKAIQSDDGFSRTSTEEESQGLLRDIEHLKTDADSTVDQADGRNPDSSDDCIEVASQYQERSKFMITLLKSARLCLVSSHYLKKVFLDPLISRNKIAREMVFNASLYQTLSHSSGQWPSGATHRACSSLINVGVYIENNTRIKAISLLNHNKYSHLYAAPNLNNAEVVCCNNTLYAVGRDAGKNGAVKLMVLINDKWKTLFTLHEDDEDEDEDDELNSLTFFITVADIYIYITNPINKSMKFYNIVTSSVADVIDLPSIESIDFVFEYENNLLIFHTETKSDADETAVHSFDTVNQTWTRLNNLEGSGSKMTCFKNDEDSYLLKNNGDLWKIVTTELGFIDFEFLSRLWDFTYNLYGAVTYNDELFIFGEDPKVKPADKMWPEKTSWFSKISVQGSPAPCSRFVPAVLPKTTILF